MPFSRALALLLCAVFALVCLSKARLIGDGMEYLAMAQGFVAHGSPELRESDIEAFRAMPPTALARARLEPDVLAQAFDRVKHEGTIEIGFARGSDGGVHAIHFWMYSLLAAPFHALVTLLGQNPFMTLVALNLAILGATAWRLRAWLPATGLPELGLLVLMGPAYYAVWIGPELLTGCCVLLATLAALRRDLSVTVALAGLAASQNPSVAGLIVAAAAYALLYRRFPSSGLLPPAPQRRHPVLLVLLGLGAAILPYIHNQVLFGMPSIIGRYYTDMGLITPERLFSFLFDLNQGMLIGLPGLLACIALGAWRRRAWLLQLGIALLLTLGMALPTLGAVNWNSGALIVPRYVYWCAMPLLAVCLAGLVQLDARLRWLVLALALLLQGLAGWQAYRSKGPSFTAHGMVATWVLDHAPRYYNPDPEIFLERERHREDLATHEQVVVHHGPKGPTKLMRFWSNSEDAGGLCPPGSHLAADHVLTLGSGWRYYNAPLHCKPGPAPALRVDIGAGMQPILGAGWSVVQGEAVWNEGPRATLRVPLPAGRRARALGLEGHYHGGLRRSRIVINGIDVGDFALGLAPLGLPAALASAPVLDVEIVHTKVPGPASERDPRALGFLLQGVTVEFAD